MTCKAKELFDLSSFKLPAVGVCHLPAKLPDRVLKLVQRGEEPMRRLAVLLSDAALRIGQICYIKSIQNH